MRNPVENASKARFGRLKKKLTRLNPDIDIESVLDPELDYYENVDKVKKAYPDAVINAKQQTRISRGGQSYSVDQDDSADEGLETFRNALEDEYSISNKKLQNLIAETTPPLSTEEMGTLQFLTGGGRSLRAVAIDKAKQARNVDDARDYVNHFNRGDVDTLDSRPKKYVPLRKLKKENREEWKKRVAENKARYEQYGMV